MEYAPTVFRALRGVFCVYKPEGLPTLKTQEMVKKSLAQEMNTLQCRPIRQRVVFQQSEESSLPVPTTVPDYADHPLVVGPRYQPRDFRVYSAGMLATGASGLVVMSVNKAATKLIEAARFMRVYHLKGELGFATEDGTPRSRIISRSKYRHVTHHKMDNVLASMQSGNQRNMFFSSGVDMESQEAYELAQEGHLRSQDTRGGTAVYGIKCVHYEPPKFTLEVHTVNESFDYLTSIIHNLGIKLKTTAATTQVRRIRYGYFNLDHAILTKDFNIQSVLDNIRLCRPLVTEEKLLLSPGIKMLSEEELQRLQPGLSAKQYLSEGQKYLPE